VSSNTATDPQPRDESARGDCAGKVALITGASSGIGAALARRLAEDGASVVLCARRTDRLATLAAELGALGRDALVCRCDVTEPTDLARAVAAAEERFGHLDIVIANAGFGVVGPVDALDVADFRRQFETNVFGVLHTVQAALPALKRSHGVLALLGSVAGYVALPHAAPYSMSKFAVRALADSLYGELRAAGVAVTLVSAGFITSELRQVDNQGRRHEGARDPVPAWLRMPAPAAARRIVAAIAKRRREVIVTGHGRLIVLAQRLAPGLVAALVSRRLRGRHEPGR
jgi:NADP-dependent 3-hydroxy acid dehydrogenase YdfG